MKMDSKRNAEHYPDPTAYEAIRNAEPARFPFRPLVYVCSPYAGDVEANVQKAREYCRYAKDQGCRKKSNMPGVRESLFVILRKTAGRNIHEIHFIHSRLHRQ